MLIESSLCFPSVWSLISVTLCIFLSHLFKDTKPCKSTQKRIHTHKCMLTHYTVTNTHLALISALISSTSPLLTISHYFTAFCSSHIHSIYLLFIKRNRAWPQPHTCRTACSFFKFISFIYAMQRTDCLNNSACKYWNIL